MQLCNICEVNTFFLVGFFLHTLITLIALNYFIGAHGINVSVQVRLLCEETLLQVKKTSLVIGGTQAQVNVDSTAIASSPLNPCPT